MSSTSLGLLVLQHQSGPEWIDRKDDQCARKRQPIERFLNQWIVKVWQVEVKDSTKRWWSSEKNRER